MKKLIKSAVFRAIKHSGAMRFQEAVAARTGHSFLTVLLFHRVTDEIPPDGITVGTAWFHQICGMLKKSFHVVPLEEVFRIVRDGAPFSPRTVAITFDDSYRDNLPAARVLAEHGLPACFFIPTSFVGTDKVFPWDRGLPRLANLTWDDVREMAGMGFEIGSHTITHPNLGELDAAATLDELAGSKRTLENELRRPVRWFAYPFGGRHNLREEQMALIEESGYEGCVSAYGGFINHRTDPRLLPREAVPEFRDNLSLEMYLSGCLRWLYALKRRLAFRTLEKSWQDEHRHGWATPTLQAQ